MKVETARRPALAICDLIAGLQAACTEAERLAGALQGLDRAVGEACVDHGIGATALQDADLMRQEAEGLAQFLDALARQVKAGEICDLSAATSPLRLRAQAARLAGLQKAPAKEEVDLWGPQVT